MSFENRLRCLKGLKKLGFQTGSGNIIGLKGQNLKILAEDIIFFKDEALDMIGIGPFIPHHETELALQARGDISLTLKVMALTRIVVKYAHMPATTALGSQEKDFRVDGLKAGANVLMPNFTPLKYKALYEIYPGKRCITEDSVLCTGCLARKVESIGRKVDYSRGDSVKIQ
jgi:biotin synthase